MERTRVVRWAILPLAFMRDEIADGHIVGPRLVLWRGEAPRALPPLGNRGPADGGLLEPPSLVPLLRGHGDERSSPGWAK